MGKSMLEDIAGNDDFAQCSFEIDELNVSNELLSSMPSQSPLQELKRGAFQTGKGDNDMSLRRRRKTSLDIMTESEAQDAPIIKSKKTALSDSDAKEKLKTDPQVLFIGEIIQSLRMISDDEHSCSSDSKRHPEGG